MSSPAVLEERGYLSPPHYEVEESFKLPEGDDILKLTTGVVKTVKELSDRVHKSKPNDYVDLVKVREGGLVINVRGGRLRIEP